VAVAAGAAGWQAASIIAAAARRPISVMSLFERLDMILLLRESNESDG
jgi:hypothetical protein